MELFQLEILMKSLVLSSPNGLTVSNLERDFKNEVGFAIPYRNFGYISLESFLDAFNSLILEKSRGVTFIKARSSSKTKHIERMISAQKNKKHKKIEIHRQPRTKQFSYKKNEYITKLNKVECAAFEGNSCNISEHDNTKGNCEPKMEKKINCTFTDYRPSSSTNHLNEPDDLGSHKVYKNLIEEKQISNLKFSTHTNKTIDSHKNVASLGDKILPAEKIIDLAIGSKFLLYVSELHNPYKFWFHFNQRSEKLKDIMRKIELFYKNVNNNLVFSMSRQNIIPEQLCVAFYNDHWYRAKILQAPIDKLVKVYFVDYGTVDYVVPSLIKYIHRDFIAMPAQAHRGCLSFLKPANMRWTRECSYFLIDMVCEKKLWAKLFHFDEVENIYHLSLLDTNYDIDININACLIRKGFADLCEEIEEIEVHYQYLYPTFDMLEKGEYASFEELGKMLANGQDYEAEEYQTLKSINPKKLYGYSPLQFWNFVRKY